MCGDGLRKRDTKSQLLINLLGLKDIEEVFCQKKGAKLIAGG